MPRMLHYDAGKRLALHALANGGRRVSQMRIEWDLSGSCQAPKPVEIYVRPDPRMRKWLLITPLTQHPLCINMDLRCRRCDRCLQARRVLWVTRAKAEFQGAIRTWFGTITLRPDRHHWYLMLARRKLALQGIDLDGLSFKEQFTLHHDEISVSLTKYIKRLRKQSGAPIRYLLVAEQHKSGFPHYHMLLHEQSFLSPVKHALLTAQWHEGFTKWNLIHDVRQATYLCKYLSKSAAARVRASQRYGENALSISAAVAAAVGKSPLPRDYH